jgi:hypothetical protein
MQRTRFVLAVALVLCAPAAPRADALADLRARLAALKPAGPFAARIDIRSTGTKGDEGDASRVERAAAVDVVQDDAGLRLQWNAAEIATARSGKIAQERNPEAAKTGGLAELSAISAAELLDAAPALLLRLEGAVLLETRPESYKGAPATLFSLSLRNPTSVKDRKRMKLYEAGLKLWLDAEGWPLGMEERIRVRYSFMFIGVNIDNTVAETYARTADRLYVTLRTEDNAVSGLGQKGGTRSTLRITPRAG